MLACVRVHACIPLTWFVSLFLCLLLEWNSLLWMSSFKKKKKSFFFWGGGWGNGGSGVREGMLNSLFPPKSNLISAFILKLIDGYFWVNLQTLPSLHKFWVFSFPRVKKMEKRKEKKKKKKRGQKTVTYLSTHLLTYIPTDLPIYQATCSSWSFPCSFSTYLSIHVLVYKPITDLPVHSDA